MDDDAWLGVRFRALVGEWRMGPMETALLLGVDGSDLGWDLVPRAPGPDAMRRMALLGEVRDRLPAIVPAGDRADRWLRRKDGEDMSPILFMSHGCTFIRALIEAIDARAGPTGRACR